MYIPRPLWSSKLGMRSGMNGWYIKGPTQLPEMNIGLADYGGGGLGVSGGKFAKDATKDAHQCFLGLDRHSQRC